MWGGRREGSLPFSLSGPSMLPIGVWEGDRVLLGPIWGPGFRGTQRSRVWHTRPCQALVPQTLRLVLPAPRVTPFPKDRSAHSHPQPQLFCAPEALRWGFQDRHTISH